MVWQSLSSSLFPTNENYENRNCDRPLSDQRDIKINQKLTATYGSVSLDATATTMNNGSSVLVANVDSESCSDGIHKIVDGENGMDSDIYYCCCTWKEYFFSWRFLELVLCVVPFTALWMYFEFGAMSPRMRPMPFQTINGATISTAEDDNWEWESLYTNVVWNSVNTEKSLGETIGHEEYQILMGLLPWLLQLLLVCFLEARKGTKWDTLHRTTCMYFVGIGTTDCITNCVKYYVSRVRR